MVRNTTITEDLVPPGAKIDNRNLELLEEAYRTVLEAIGEDPDRQGLRRTPIRAARALEFMTQGYRQNLDDIINDAIFDSEASEIIQVTDIDISSLCET